MSNGNNDNVLRPLSETDSDEQAAGKPKVETRFTCKKCPNQEFFESEKEAHREFHRNEKRKTRGQPEVTAPQPTRPKPGPKSKTRRQSPRLRSQSPAPSSGTLFVVQNKTNKDLPNAGKKRKATEVAGLTENEEEEHAEDDISPAARQSRAVKHYKQAKNWRRKYSGA